jgi:hypothetical protein
VRVELHDEAAALMYERGAFYDTGRAPSYRPRSLYRVCRNTGLLLNRTSQLRFEDIPRQLTPEGNVLRVDGSRARAEVER